MGTEYDLIIIGGGVLGTFHAYHAIRKGLKVALMEKDQLPQGATTRNFGQVVPSGMDSKWQRYGRTSLGIYKELQAQFDITVRQGGSVYFASDQQEQLLLEELHQINRANDYESELLTKAQCLDRYRGLRADYVKAGLFFPQEITVEPRTMIVKLQQYLGMMGLERYYYHCVVSCGEQGSGVQVITASGLRLSAAKLLICNGSEFKILYPGLFSESDLVATKLQMLQTVPQSNYTLPGSVLTGLTIRRYESFSECPSFTKIKATEDGDAYWKQWGVHILFKQAVDGSIILGDSHEYAAARDIDQLGFDINVSLNNYMIEEAMKIIELPSYEIRNQWTGTYTQCKERDIFEHTVGSNIHIVTGIGGKGMTGSAGYSADSISRIFNK